MQPCGAIWMLRSVRRHGRARRALRRTHHRRLDESGPLVRPRTRGRAVERLLGLRRRSARRIHNWSVPLRARSWRAPAHMTTDRVMAPTIGFERLPRRVRGLVEETAIIRAAAAELPRVDLGDAFAVCVAIREAEPDRFEHAALRWLARSASSAAAQPSPTSRRPRPPSRAWPSGRPTPWTPSGGSAASAAPTDQLEPPTTQNQDQSSLRSKPKLPRQQPSQTVQRARPRSQDEAPRKVTIKPTRQHQTRPGTHLHQGAYTVTLHPWDAGAEPSAKLRRHPERGLSRSRSATRPATRARAWPGSRSMTRPGLRSGSSAGRRRRACASESWWPRRWNAALARPLRRRTLLRRCVRFMIRSRCSSRTCGLLSLQAAREPADSYFS